MTERPNAVLGVLLGAAVLVAGLIIAGLAGLGGPAVAFLAATIVGALSACAFFVHELGRAPLESLLLVGLTVASTLALIRIGLASLREQRLLRSLPLEPIAEGPLLELAREAGARELLVSPASSPDAFCFGFVRPRVVVTAGLLDRLDPEEQAAVVLHEAHHARAREPSKCLAARLAATTFFWTPILGDLRDRYLLAKELAADRVACARTSRSALAGALAEVSGAPAPATSVGLGELASARVDRLFDPEAKLPPLVRRSSLLISGLSVGGLALVTVFPARLDLDRAAHLGSMLTGTPLHGLPGMAVGLAVNVAAIAVLLYIARRVVRWPRRGRRLSH